VLNLASVGAAVTNIPEPDDATQPCCRERERDCRRDELAQKLEKLRSMSPSARKKISKVEERHKLSPLLKLNCPRQRFVSILIKKTREKSRKKFHSLGLINFIGDIFTATRIFMPTNIKANLFSSHWQTEKV